MMLSFRRLVIGGGGVRGAGGGGGFRGAGGGGKVGGPTQVVEKTCSEKILFMSGPFFRGHFWERTCVFRSALFG